MPICKVEANRVTNEVILILVPHFLANAFKGQVDFYSADCPDASIIDEELCHWKIQFNK